ncbi:MAG: PTS system mannose/fructose/sorbose family transporter subunit IID [Thermodesulfobacteriota bacterium]
MDRLTLGRVLWRSFFLQAAWNYAGQQNLGFAASLQPALEKMHGGDTSTLQAALEEALRPFNTQPYMSGPILGSMIRVAETGAASDLTPDRLSRFQTALSTAFAAIGDAFFWNALLPAAAAAGMFWAVSGRWDGAAVFLVLYNAGHLFIRLWGFRAGYRHGLDVARVLDHLKLPLLALRLRLVTAGALGALAGWVLAGTGGGTRGWPELSGLGLGVMVAILLLARLIRRGLPVEVMIYALPAGLWLLAWAL